MRRIGYLLNLFPKLSETFVLNEVVNLQHAGLDILPISLERSAKLEPVQHPAAQRLLRPPVYAVDGFPREHLRALFDWILHRPRGLLRLVAANRRLPTPYGESRALRLAIALRTGSLVVRERIDHLHAHWSYPADVAYLLAPILGVSVSLTAHAHDIYEDVPLYEAGDFPYERRAMRARFIVTCTSTNTGRVRSLLPEELGGRVHLVYHGLDVAEFSPNGVARDEPPLLVSVGRQVWCKGFDLVVEAARILRDEGRDFRVAIVGPQGPETRRLERLIADHALGDRVVLVGGRTQDELRDLYRHAAVFVNASWPEGEYGVANVIVEALACGVPVVATDRPHVREYVVHGESALLVEPGDPAALAAAVGRLLDDERLRAELSRGGRAVAERMFDIDAATRALVELFTREAG